jgi:hypothetical protein
MNDTLRSHCVVGTGNRTGFSPGAIFTLILAVWPCEYTDSRCLLADCVRRFSVSTTEAHLAFYSHVSVD